MMSTIWPSKETADGDAPAPPPPQRPVGDRILDRIITSTYLLPILLIGGAIWYLGFTTLYLLALGIGVVVWAYWGRKMTMADGKLALVVDVESGEIAPFVIGRSRWSRATKEGRPFLSFRTPAGLSVEVIKEYDPELNHVIYPPSGGYSDIMIASIPSRYGELIDELIQTSKSNMILSTELDVHALSMAQEHIGAFSAEINKVITPRDKPKEKEDTDEI